MGLLQGNRQSERDDSSIPFSGGIAHSGRDAAEDTLTRHEPLAFGARRVPVDPYSAWLAQRDSERAFEERPPTRWVHRYRGVGAPAGSRRIIGAEPRERDATAPQRLVGV
jgi:hypothetical protein